MTKKHVVKSRTDEPAAGAVYRAPVDERAFEHLDPDEPRGTNMVALSFLALLVGIAAGVGAIFFRELIGLVHNILFLGQFAFHYDTKVFTPTSPWGVLVIFVPVIGAIVVTFLVTTFAPEAKGHGVPEVMDAIYYSSGAIRPVVAAVKSVASAVAIGSGAAVGREGPIIQIGSAFGSTLGQILRMSAAERIVLVACGGAGGIAATFNTPIGGVIFAIEILLPELSSRTFLPVAIATSTATFIGRYWFGLQPAFAMPTLVPLAVDISAALSLFLYAALGLLVGFAATVFVRGLYFIEDLFERIPNNYIRHALGMLIVGIIIFAVKETAGEYYIGGVGYATDQAILFGHLADARLLFVLYLCELLATSITLGSGSSGGIFSPSLYMGATLGGGFAMMLSGLHLPIPINVPSFAVVGMAAMVGGATGAALTAITMLFEMTRDYGIMLPMILAVAVSVGIRRLWSPDSIYTLKLVRRGHVIPDALHANMFMVRRAASVMERHVTVAPASMPLNSVAPPSNDDPLANIIVVTRNDRIDGVVHLESAEAKMGVRSDSTLGDVVNRKFCVVRERDIFFNVIRRMWRTGAAMALVVHNKGGPQPDNVSGVITREHVADVVAASVFVFPSRA